MKALVFSSRSYSETALKAENKSGSHDFKFLETKLDTSTAPLGEGYAAVLVFVNDKVDRGCLKILAAGGTKHDDAAAGHVLAPMVAATFDHRVGAAIANAEPLGRPTTEKRLATGRSV